jgi:hypothetical protein
METPHLDNLINDLKSYDRNDMLSDEGRNQLNEYEAIKQALSLGDVVGQSEQLKPLPPRECSQCSVLIDHRLNECGDCRL